MPFDQDMAGRLKVAQIGTKHGHAAGKMASMMKNPDLVVVGCFEPDHDQLAKVKGKAAYEGVHWFATMEELLVDESIVMVAAESYNLDSLDHCGTIPVLQQLQSFLPQFTVEPRSLSRQHRAGTERPRS